MKNFKDMASLQKAILLQMETSLRGEVSETIKAEQSKQVETEVYDKYAPNNGEPWVYQRRKQDGGLSDMNNMRGTPTVAGHVIDLTITNETPSADGEGYNIAPIIEQGDQSKYKYRTVNEERKAHPQADAFLEPRPFIQATRDSLRQSGALSAAFAKGMGGSAYRIK